MNIFHFGDPVQVTVNGVGSSAAMICTNLSAGERAFATARGLTVQVFGSPTAITIVAPTYTHTDSVNNVLVVPSKAHALAIYDARDNALAAASEHQFGAYAVTTDGVTALRTFTDPAAAACAAQQLFRNGTPAAVVEARSPDGNIYQVMLGGVPIAEFRIQAAAQAAATARGGGATVSSRPHGTNALP